MGTVASVIMFLLLAATAAGYATETIYAGSNDWRAVSAWDWSMGCIR